MKATRILALLLTLTMALALAGLAGAAAFADDIPDITMELSDEDRQLAFIQSQASALRQQDSDVTWYYAVTDLDRDGNLEFVAAAQHPQNRSTNLRVWEVSADRTELAACSLAKNPEESFPDILTDVTDTYRDAATDTWYYLFYDNIVLSDEEVITIKTAVKLKDGVIGYEAFALERTVLVDGRRVVSHTDTDGRTISQEQYNASGSNALAGMERSSTCFEWLNAREAEDLTRLTDSFSVFMGRKAPTEVFPVPRPAALDAPLADTPAAAQQIYLSVTKNPTNEDRREGETAYFISAASAYESLNWTFVSPNGGEYSAQAVQNMWGGVAGQDSTTLSIANVNTGMDGWGAYCTFFYKGQTARTATAYLYVSPKRQSPPSGSYAGSVTDWSFSSVTVSVQSVTVTLDRGFCDIDGELYYGAPAAVLWDGQNIVACYITGSAAPTPQDGSMGGTAYEGGGGFAVYLASGDQVFVDGWLCNISGWFYPGAPCVVYYLDYPSAENIYYVDIYGSDEPPYDPEETVGTMFCPNCGSEIPDNTEVCPYCAYPVWDPDLDPIWDPVWAPGYDADDDILISDEADLI